MPQLDHTHDDSVVANLIAALASGGEEVDEGQFTIDVAGAETLGRYQLADPSLWPVFLVEVAVLLRGRAIEFRVSGWVIEARIASRFVPPALVDELDRMHRSPGRRGDDPRKLLGVAWRGAQQRGRDKLVFEAVGDDGRGRRRTWRASDERGDTVDCEGEPGLRVWVRFASDVADPAEPERAWLLRRCRPSRFPVWLDGKQISVGWIGAFGSFGENRVNAKVPLMRRGDPIGLAGLHEHAPAGGRVLLMQNQVVIEELPFPVAIRAFTAAIEIDADRDLSLTRFIRGPELAAAVEAVEEAYPKVRKEAAKAAQRLQTALALPDVSQVAPEQHAADQLELRRAIRSPAKIAGGVATLSGVGLWLLIGQAGIWTLAPMLLIGVGLVLLFGEFG